MSQRFSLRPEWGTPLRPSQEKRAVALACLLMFVPAAVAGRAGADPVDGYTATHAAAVCSTLDAYPSFDGIAGVADAITQQTGFTYYEAGGIIYDSVAVWCPRHLGLLQRYVDTYVLVAPAVSTVVLR